MLINYVKIHSNARRAFIYVARKCMYTHTKIHIIVYKMLANSCKNANKRMLKMTQTYINNYIGGVYIGMLFIPEFYTA